MKYPNLGSVSHGTMRPEDLIPCFLAELLKHDPDHAVALDIQETLHSRTDYFGSEDDLFDLDTLFDILNQLAPPYCYFGSHPGDGSDFGFWLDEDWRERAEEDEVPLLDGSDSLPKGFFGMWFFISDHGNVTLYQQREDGTSTEIFGVV
jgi:hypothetical protein